jgi:hypothetical protein
MEAAPISLTRAYGHFFIFHAENFNTALHFSPTFFKPAGEQQKRKATELRTVLPHRLLPSFPFISSANITSYIKIYAVGF